MPRDGRSRLLAALRWVAGDQGIADAPDARDRARVLEKTWARDVGAGGLELTDDGRLLLEDLVAGVESTGALRLALTTSVTYGEARRALEDPTE